jgi:hypothetical protein
MFQIDDHIADTARCRLDLDYGKILLKNRELEQNEVCEYKRSNLILGANNMRYTILYAIVAR